MNHLMTELFTVVNGIQVKKKENIYSIKKLNFVESFLLKKHLTIMVYDHDDYYYECNIGHALDPHQRNWSDNEQEDLIIEDRMNKIEDFYTIFYEIPFFGGFEKYKYNKDRTLSHINFQAILEFKVFNYYKKLYNIPNLYLNKFRELIIDRMYICNDIRQFYGRILRK